MFQIAHIWNETNTNLEVNVTGLNSNIEMFVRLFVELIQIPPDGQNLISNFLNWDIIMKFFVDNMANPDL
ncbi:hypothetical protein DPMN_036645 [Dreissena polymorpha]|uniref:Uncharacterized protein n=1 Tax=Dreissena polymorpha TaxID=45954 RepID=A0A9D4M9T4_DREPO|nr:hypothetical protein DPMN_036645 [Dreissena polymorpha]